MAVDAQLARAMERKVHEVLGERLAALDMIGPRADRPNAVTLGGDKGYDAADFVMELREINVTPHIARNTQRSVRSAPVIGSKSAIADLLYRPRLAK